jgi:hypothetical protein
MAFFTNLVVGMEHDVLAIFNGASILQKEQD